MSEPILPRFSRPLFQAASRGYGRLARLVYPIHPLPPLRISVLITSGCNLRCTFCPYRGKHGPAEEERLSAAEWRRIAASIPPFTVVDFASAEPLLAPDIWDILAELRRRKRIVWICSNGTLMTRDHARYLVEQQLCYLRVSIDGMAEYHNRVRGRPDAFERATQGLRWIKEEKERRGSRWPITAIKTNLLPDNGGDIPQLLEFAEKELRVDQIFFNLVYDNDLLGGLEPAQDFRHPTFQAGNTYRYPAESIPAVQEAVRRIFEYRARSPMAVGMSQDMGLADTLDCIADPGRYGVSFCVEPWCGFTLFYNGLVCPCCLSYEVGNIRDMDYNVNRVLPHPRYREFLSFLRAHSPFFPPCGGCVTPHSRREGLDQTPRA